MPIELFNKDCFLFLETVEDNKVDLVLIDPPYIISRDTGFMNTQLDKYKTLSYDFGSWDVNEIDIERLFKECYRVLKKHGTLICFYDLWKIESLKASLENNKFKQIRFIEWIKTNPVPVNSKLNYLSNVREIAVLGVKHSKPTFNSVYDKGIYNYPICNDKDRFHPTQKPVNLMEDLVIKHSKENDLVLDCFSGSGSCMVACYNTNRNFIGCEIDKDYYDKSLERIKKNEARSKDTS